MTRVKLNIVAPENTKGMIYYYMPPSFSGKYDVSFNGRDARYDAIDSFIRLGITVGFLIRKVVY